MGKKSDIRLEGRTRRCLSVPVELFTDYQPMVGPLAVAAWLNLRVLVETQHGDTAREYLMSQMDLDGRSVDNILKRLENVGLLKADGTGWILKEPTGLPRQAPVEQPETVSEEEFWDQVAASVALEGEDLSLEPTAQEQTSLPTEVNPDLDSVLELYANRIGLIGPTQYQKLEYWMEHKKMSADVIALAIEETALSAQSPRFEYLEGILRNWSNQGVRTVDHLIKKKIKVRALAGMQPEETVNETYEGWPNATAYNIVDEDRLKIWKELYPDD